MTEHSGQNSVGTGTAEIPRLIPEAQDPAGEASASGPPEPNVVADVPGTSPGTGPDPTPGPVTEQPAPPPGATAPVAVRPRPRAPRRGPLTLMGPWAPVAGGVLGLLLGAVAVAVVGGSAVTFEDRLALVFTVLGLGMLGTAGVLLADEVALMRRRAREAAVRPQWVSATAGLLNGLTPARLLLLSSGFVLFLAAFVSS